MYYDDIADATDAQKSYLRKLGYRGTLDLAIDEASQLIDHYKSLPRQINGLYKEDGRWISKPDRDTFFNFFWKHYKSFLTTKWLIMQVNYATNRHENLSDLLTNGDVLKYLKRKEIHNDSFLMAEGQDIMIQVKDWLLECEMALPTPGQRAYLRTMGYALKDIALLTRDEASQKIEERKKLEETQEKKRTGDYDEFLSAEKNKQKKFVKETMERIAPATEESDAPLESPTESYAGGKTGCLLLILCPTILLLLWNLWKNMA